MTYQCLIVVKCISQAFVLHQIKAWAQYPKQSWMEDDAIPHFNSSNSLKWFLFYILTWSPLAPLGPCCPRGPGCPWKAQLCQSKHMKTTYVSMPAVCLRRKSRVLILTGSPRAPDRPLPPSRPTWPWERATEYKPHEPEWMISGAVKVTVPTLYPGSPDSPLSPLSPGVPWKKTQKYTSWRQIHSFMQFYRRQGGRKVSQVWLTVSPGEPGGPSTFPSSPCSPCRGDEHLETGFCSPSLYLGLL